MSSTSTRNNFATNMNFSDILLEILSRSSLETVGKCRVLSREYNTLSYESMFTNLHCQRTKTVSGYFLQTQLHNQFYSTFVNCDKSYNTNTQISLDFLPRFKQILASTKQGLMLCGLENERNHYILQYVVCKPTTRQWCKIPNPSRNYFTVSTAMIVLSLRPLHYKILKLSKYDNNPLFFSCYFPLVCEVFDSNKWEWKRLENALLFNSEILQRAPAVSACGSLHWLTDHGNLLAFDGQKNTCSITSLPGQIQGSNGHIELMDYEGKLAIITKGEDYMDLWVLENYQRKVWNMRKRIDLEGLKSIHKNVSPLAFSNADVAMFKGDFEMFFYKLTNQKTDTVELRNHVQECGVFHLVSDFETCDL